LIIEDLLRPTWHRRLRDSLPPLRIMQRRAPGSGHFSPGRIRRNGAAIRAFALVNTETTMPFSLSSYLLGVGTVVGALGFGFGGGVLLTKTAMKDTPVAETRVERVKRADSPSPSAP